VVCGFITQKSFCITGTASNCKVKLIDASQDYVNFPWFLNLLFMKMEIVYCSLNTVYNTF